MRKIILLSLSFLLSGCSTASLFPQANEQKQVQAVITNDMTTKEFADYMVMYCAEVSNLKVKDVDGRELDEFNRCINKAMKTVEAVDHLKKIPMLKAAKSEEEQLKRVSDTISGI